MEVPMEGSAGYTLAMTLIDLHTHSRASDGTLTPTELVALAGEKGLAAVALTDHDTLAGLAEAGLAGRASGVEVVPGVELSVADGDCSIHILGLFLADHPGGPLAEALTELRAKRHDRNRLILEKLARLGIPIAYADVQALAKGTVGRPHIAQVMLARGAVASVKEAFSRYLGNHGRAYVPKEKLELGRAIDLLHAEGALVILAHPSTLGQKGRTLIETVGRYRDRGLDGIEVFYSEHSQSQTLEYLALSRRFGLALSGGSDFHGDTKPGVELGRGRGNLKVDVSILDKLKERLAGRG